MGKTKVTESREVVTGGWWESVDCKGAQGILWDDGTVPYSNCRGGYTGYTFVKTQTVHLEYMHFIVCNVDLEKK